MISLTIALALLSLASFLAMQGIREFRNGSVSLNFWWTSPKLEASKLEDVFAFWFILGAKVLIIGAMSYFALNLMRQP